VFLAARSSSAVLPLALLRRLPLKGFYGSADGVDFRGQEVLAKSVFRKLATDNLFQVDESHRHGFPAEPFAGTQSPFPGYQPPVRPHDDWVQQAQFFDAGGQGFDIAQILSLAVADLDSGD
jgi:hypothetical protein